MGLLDIFRKYKAEYVLRGNLNVPVWTTQKDKQFITEGYNRVVWVYACVGAISSAVSSVPWLLYRKGRAGRLIEVTEHPILTMLNVKANPYMSSKDFLDYWASYLAIEGKFYAEYSAVKNPQYLFPLYPHYVYPIPHRTEFIAGFEYRMSEPIKYQADELLWSKFNDPLDVYQGQSPIRALSRTIDTENEAVDWNKATLQNAGVPAGVFQVQNPSPELSRKLEEEWVKRYGGGSNARKPLILNSDKANYLPLGLSPVDMDFLNQRKVNRIEICSAFGVPSQIVGDPEGQTYSNYGEAQKAFWENTVISRYLDHIKEKLEQDLLPRFADNLVLKYDLSSIGALKENEDKKATRIRELWKAGIITRNEARYELNYDEDLNGNIYFNELALGATSAIEQPSSAIEQQPVTEQETESEVEDVEMEDQTEVEPMDDEQDVEIESEDENETEIPNITVIINNLIENAVKKKDISNFPKQGEDKEISLRNSDYPLFPFDYAENLRLNYPEIWDEGGNIQGNDTYRTLSLILKEDKTADELTNNDKEIIKMREAWSARHYRDHRLAGVIAQVKWLMIGSRGLDHMKAVIQEAKDKQEKSVDLNFDGQKAYWKKIDKERERFIDRTANELKTMFRDEQQKMNRAITNSTQDQLIAEMNRVIDGDKKKLSRILTADYVATIDHFGKQTFNDLTNQKMLHKAFDPYTDDIKQWIALNIANAVTYVTDTTKREIRSIIENGIINGLPIGDELTEDTIAFNIGKLYLDQIIPNRSETIARTETITASNHGSLEAAKQSGARVLKYWIPTSDGDTRDTHMAMTSHPAIGLNELFDVGQSQGQFPSDAKLSAKERINCRCAVGYKRINEGGEE